MPNPELGCPNVTRAVGFKLMRYFPNPLTQTVLCGSRVWLRLKWHPIPQCTTFDQDPSRALLYLGHRALFRAQTVTTGTNMKNGVLLKCQAAENDSKGKKDHPEIDLRKYKKVC
jgi:hypothetical protein